MSVLVTGGAGFIGSHVARHLVDAGQDVVVLDDLSGGYEENVPAGANLVAGSVVDPALRPGSRLRSIPFPGSSVAGSAACHWRPAG